jgi:tetratricopeptide (TPR) repeat protein
MSGEPGRAMARAARLRERAAAAGNRVGALHAELGRLRVTAQTDPEGVAEALRLLIDEARPVFEAEGYDAGLAALWSAVETIEHGACRFDVAREACERALEHARRAGDSELAHLIMPGLVVASTMGSRPIDQLLPWLDELTEMYGVRPWIESPRASLLAFTGRLDEARALHGSTVAGLEERGATTVAAILGQTGFVIEMLAGDVVAAERIMRRGCEQLQAMGERGWLSTQACMLADALARLDRDAEAAEWVDLGRSLGASDDVITQVLARRVLARLAARRGDAAEAEALAREALRLASPMQDLVQKGDAHAALSEVLAMTGRPDGAREELARAEALYRRKGATACIAMARRHVAASARRFGDSA